MTTDDHRCDHKFPAVLSSTVLKVKNPVRSYFCTGVYISSHEYTTNRENTIQFIWGGVQ